MEPLSAGLIITFSRFLSCFRAVLSRGDRLSRGLRKSVVRNNWQSLLKQRPPGPAALFGCQVDLLRNLGWSKPSERSTRMLDGPPQLCEPVRLSSSL